MRDWVIAVAIAFLCLRSLSSGYIGFLGWIWVSMMNPHRLAFGWIYNQPVAMIMFIFMFVGLILDRNKSRLFQHGIVVLQLFFVIWMVITTYLAIFPENSMDLFERVMKIQLGVFITYLVVNTKDRLIGLLWMMFFSVGYYGIKGGIFTLRTAGTQKVWGPEGSNIYDNNHLACALLMTMPIGLYLMSTLHRPIAKKILLFCIIMIGVSALGSSSRGAMLGLLTVCLLWLSKVPGKQKVLAALAIGFFGVIALTIMPESWWDRMNSVKTYDKDASAMGRINAWWCAFNLAKDRLTGGGFEFNTPTAFALYAPDPNDIHAAHSIYFQVLGDHGFVGIGLFLLIAVSTWLLLAKIVKRTTNNPDFLWANQMARFIQLSLAAYYVAGAFLSLAYYDLYWQLIAVSVVLNTLTKSSVPLEKPAMISADKTQSRVPEIRGAFVRMN